MNVLPYVLNRLLDKTHPPAQTVEGGRENAARWMLAELRDMPACSPELHDLASVEYDASTGEFVSGPPPVLPASKPIKLFIGLPVYGGYNPHFITSMFHLLTHRPCELVVYPLIGESLVSRARNRIVAKFLASDCTHLLQLDTDLIFSPDHIARLVSHALSDLSIVAGLYPKKQKELGWVCNVLDTPQEPDANGLVPVKYAGTGCLLVARHVFGHMIEVLPEIEYDPDDGDEPGLKWDFFATGVHRVGDRRRYLSEDWMFCERARSLGYSIWMDTQTVLKHVGEMIYPLQNITEFADPLTPAK